MDEVIVIDSEESENSIVELEVPKKPPPPVFEVDDDDEDLLLNIQKQNRQTLLAKDIINMENESSKPVNSMEILKLVSPDHWTTDMMKFYNDDWGNEENFIVEKMQENMDRDPSLWAVSRKDILNMENKLKKSNIKCFNCCQKGHPAALCPDPPHVPKCHMCGTPGHLVYNCPNSKCLNCGNPCRDYVTFCFKCSHQTKMVCTRCQLLGHNFINCSDHWRLFHMTVGSTSIKIPPKNIYKAEKDMWCCNCGRRGHVNTQCKRGKNYNGFTDNLPFVASYHKAFNYNNNDNNCHNQNKMPGVPWKKNKQKNKESIMRINPMNKAIRKNKFKKHKKKNKKNKKELYNKKQIVII